MVWPLAFLVVAMASAEVEEGVARRSAQRANRLQAGNVHSAHERFHSAVVLTYAMGRGTPPASRRRYFCLLRGVAGSLRATGYAGQIICLTLGIWDGDKDAVHALCNQVLEFSPLAFPLPPPEAVTLEQQQHWFKSQERMPPVQKLGVMTVGGVSGNYMVKLHAWNLTEYDMLLVSDLDVLFVTSPLPALRRAHAERLIFEASGAEYALRGYAGFNSHMMLIRPSRDLYAILTANAALGHFVPYTLGDQDVLETMLPLSVGEGSAGRPFSHVPQHGRAIMPCHFHWFFHKCDAGFRTHKDLATTKLIAQAAESGRNVTCVTSRRTVAQPLEVRRFAGSYVGTKGATRVT